MSDRCDNGLYALNTLVVLFCLALLAGCPAGVTYTEADAQTYEAIAPEYVDMVEANPNLTPEQKDRRKETVRSWHGRLTQAGRNVAPVVSAKGGP